MRTSPRSLRVRRLGLEPLEDRVLLSVSPTESTLDPTALEQELMEHLNRMRLDPQGELDTLFTSLDPLIARDSDANAAIDFFQDPTSQEIELEWQSLLPVAPLIWNESLHESAIGHSQLMAQYDQQSHQFPTEATPKNRAIAAGYEDALGVSVGENVFAYGNSPFHTYSAFAIDWAVPDRGHRINLMAPEYREVGIGIITDYDYGTQVGPLIVTQDFGFRPSYDQAHLLGVVFDDLDQDGLYDSDEGQGNVTIEIVGADQSYTATSMTAGGYQVEVVPGVYTLTASGGGLSAPIVHYDVVVGVDNVKVDFVGSSQPNKRPSVDLNGPSQAGSDYSTSFNRTAGPVSIVSAGMTVTDSDDEKLVSATVTISNLLDVGAEILAVDGGGTGISATFNQYTGVLRLTGSQSVANYQQVLRTLSYYNGATQPTGTSRSVAVTANDGFAESSVAVSTISFSPEISVEDARLAEGDYGTTSFAVSVSLSAASDLPVKVSYSFIDGTAQAGSDYLNQSGQITFQPGQIRQTIYVPVSGDTAIEQDEHFYVSLYNPQNASIADVKSTATIVNDDTAQDMGDLATAQIEGLNPSAGRILFSLRTLNSGTLSFEALPDGPADTVGMVLYDEFRNQQPLAVSSAIDEHQRIDWQTEADTSYYLEVNGSAEDVLLRMVNLLTVEDGDVVVHGSDGDDVFEFDAAEDYIVTVNDVQYSFEPTEIDSIEFDTGDGNDTVVFRDSSGDETLTADFGSATFVGDGFMVTATGFEELLAYATRGGNDVASLHDSPGNDKFKSYPGLAKFYGGGYFLRAKEFDIVHAYAGEGDDQARFFDSDGDDQVKVTPTYSKMIGEEYFARGKFFETVIAYSTAGGHDTAQVIDSPEDDVFQGRSHKSTFTSNAGFDLTLRRFEEVRVQATAGGFDTGKLYDSGLGDEVEAGDDWLKVYNDELDYLIEIVAFERLRLPDGTYPEPPILLSQTDLALMDEDSP